MMRHRRTLLLGLITAPIWQRAFAQTQDLRPVRLIVPFAAGGSSDVMARALAKQLSEQMGAPFLVENRPGAGGAIAMEAVARAPTDGRTLLYGTIGTNAVGPALFKSKTTDPAKDLTAVSLAALTPSVLVVNSALPIRTLSELIAYAKAHPGALTYASAGNGSISHLATELLKTMAGIEMIHVPYRGGGAASADLISGNVSLMIETITNALALTQTGKVRAIANSGSIRSPSAPELPTFAEAGLNGYSVDSWTGLFVANGTPQGVVDKLSSEVAKASRDSAYRQAMSRIGVEASSSSPAAFTEFVRSETMKWKKVVQETGTVLD